MTRRKTPASPTATASDPLVTDPDKEDFSTGRPLTRKQVLEMIRRKEGFEEADLRGCDLVGIAFDNANLARAKFAEANLSRCTFKGANLVGASFFGANLKDCSLEEANIEDADFDYANLDGVTFRGAKIRKAIFPIRRVPLKDIQESVRTGKRVQMEAMPLDEED
ncbi:MAG: pentapeptide repeat-containing protein [Pseudomonadota bacterium]|nr:pentapeptide repeat-containing protein [Pseudomonadota bacterium]